jgi:cobaltochelatase CobN
VVDLWGSATMRTGGEDFALALLLLGARPSWDGESGRVTGFEIVPLALLDRPRVDVTLRVSGLFRDAFEAQTRLFDSAARAVAARDEAADWNPLAAAFRETGRATRIYGPAPGCHGAGVDRVLNDGAWRDRAELGAAYISASGFAWDAAAGTADTDGFAARVRAADALLHTQDHAETDILQGLDTAGHVGGFAAAAALLGATPTLYHADTSDPTRARWRTAAEEVVRVVRGRAANPAWIGGMRRHGYRGAAEIARTVDALAGFAATLPDRFDRQFDLLFDATLGDEATDRFLRAANPAARAAMRARFDEALRRGLWHPRRNIVTDAA